MSTLKKLLALTLALAMVLSVSVFAGNYSADTYADAADIHEDCAEAVEVMYALDIMKGTGANFEPNAPITRAQMAKILYVILNGKDDNAVNYKGNSIFSDVPAAEWYNGYVNYCAMTKKIQGYNGKFDPNGTLTVAAAAKMLLTAIGYDADAYGFVGPNWENNVLTVAHEAGLLTDVATNLTGAAPRQWVAKMIMNSLGAYCYKTVAAIPGNGVLGNFWVGGTTTSDNITTFGEKYLNVTIKTGYLVATTKANLDAADFAASGTVTFQFGDKQVDVKGTGLTAADLGQQFTVVMKDGAAKSVRNTGKSVIGEAAIKDVTAKLTYSTSDNNEKNRYEFTIGDLTGKLNVPDTTAEIKVLDIEYNNGEKLVATTETSANLKGFMTTEGVKANTVKAIDKDADGDIDYIIYTPVEYAKVTKVGTSNKYGDYIKLENVKGAALAVKGNTNLYVEDLINCEDELFVNALVKYVWNIDTGMFDVELLETVSDVKLEGRKVTKNEYTFDGTVYAIADNAFDFTLVLKKQYNIAVDGDLLVAAAQPNTNYTDMAQVNEKLAVLLKADILNADIANARQVQLLTIDGAKDWYVYDVSGAADVENTTANKIKWSEIAPKYTSDEDPKTWGKLVIVHTNDDGEVWLEEVKPTTLGSLKTAAADLVDVVTAPKATLEVEDGKAKYNGTRIGSDVEFFAKVGKEYTVITMSDLEDGDYKNVEGVTFVQNADVENAVFYKSTVGGYLVIGSADASAQTGYLFVTDIEGLQKDEADKVITVLKNGADSEVDVVLSADSVVPASAYGCYFYTVNSDGEYKLESRWAGAAVNFTPDADLDLWFEKATDVYETIDLSDYEVIGMKVVESLRKEFDGTWEVENNDVSFVDVETLLETVAYYDGLESDLDYTYTVEFKFLEDMTKDEELLYVVIYLNMEAN